MLDWHPLLVKTRRVQRANLLAVERNRQTVDRTSESAGRWEAERPVPAFPMMAKLTRVPELEHSGSAVPIQVAMEDRWQEFRLEVARVQVAVERGRPPIGRPAPIS